MLTLLAQTTLDLQGQAQQVGADGQSTLPLSSDLLGGPTISFLLSIVMFIALLLVLFYLVKGAIDFITAGGEKSKTEAARSEMTGAVVGLVILSATLAVFMLIQQLFGFQVVRFPTTSSQLPPAIPDRNPNSQPF